MASRRSFLVAYDIRDPRRLRRVAKVMQDFGARRQLSVFICRITGAQRVEMQRRLAAEIDRSVDQVLVLPLCERCSPALDAIGIPVAANDEFDDTIIL